MDLSRQNLTSTESEVHPRTVRVIGNSLGWGLKGYKQYGIRCLNKNIELA